ncbi:hypothetical protein R4534_15770 [Acinetobacter baumannii]|uniref:hypothetical protein n=1 Tax=Acinetobacter baumannii TaxID=470 RepID=UPI0021C16EF0|nr:hypothetical protein [Acinetobacter baumannii]MCT9388671.1 hypothetical protein [Acinetobacter baumannii]MDH2521360.1 hypothetical protein [Acinetobacter baumannii]MDO7490248.1 hypothetical protein [Acinetobacter baumannii]MDV7364935.1 hypothetical protein [Acinetobacter baumannii]MDV7445132.1 hypothetical protein [Acinetobacter baumannii]
MTVLNVGDNQEIIHFFMGVKAHFEAIFKDSEFDTNYLINCYYSKFSNKMFAEKHGLLPESQELWEHWGYFEVALRVYYYEVLKHKPDQLAFIEWLNDFVKEYRA